MLVGEYCGFCGQPLVNGLKTCSICGNTMCEACLEEHKKTCGQKKREET